MKRSIIWVVLHSSALVFILISLFTGFRIAILTKPWLLWLDPILPQGSLHHLHIASGFGIAAICITYAVFSLRYFKLNELLKPKSYKPKPYKAPIYHRLVQRTGYLLFPLTILTGFLLFFDWSKWITAWDLHYWLAWFVAFYIVLHGGGYFVHYGVAIFKRILSPGNFRKHAQLISLVILSCMGITFWVLIGLNPSRTLSVAAMDIKTPMDIDGNPSEAIWRRAKRLQVQTHGGANFENGSTVVSMQAASNGEEAFFLFSWEDATKSLQHLPLVKDEKGWRVQHNGYHRYDEVAFYEDKFAVLLAKECKSGAADTAHLGPKPLADKPANWHGKGYHYALKGGARDLWHWKAVRTNDMIQADDNFFGRPQTARPGERRYTAGYVADGKESGAYVMNWLWFQSQYIVPRRIPKDPKMILPYQTDPANQTWVISWFDYEPYRIEKDEYPAGSVMPSVLYRSNRFEGDRADIRARGEWRDGRWYLEMARRLDTQSNNDVALEDGICMWVSAFDRSQIAHTRHHQAVRLIFEATDD